MTNHTDVMMKTVSTLIIIQVDNNRQRVDYYDGEVKMMSAYIEFQDVKKVYQMGEVSIESIGWREFYH